MILLLLAFSLAQVPEAALPSQDAQATLQSCEMTPAGWVCRYRMPAVILQGTPPENVIVTDRPAISLPVLPPLSSPPPPAITTAEADRRARLIARCADASWLSLCLPGDRREARVLRDAATASAALRSEVTGLLSENKCDAAVRAALAGGDLTLAWEARNFCVTVPATARAAASAD